MKKFKFKDGSIITASTVEEAKQKHKALAYTDELGKLLEEIGILGKGNIRYEYNSKDYYSLFLNMDYIFKDDDNEEMWIADIKKSGEEYWFVQNHSKDLLINKENSEKIKNRINYSIEHKINQVNEIKNKLISLKF